MTFPAVLFGCLIGLLIGALFHLVVGGGGSRFVLFLVTGLIGFWVGHILGWYLHWNFLEIGPLHFGSGLMFGILLTFIAYILGANKTTNNNGGRRVSH
jgi:hypothetical protein